jgi:site-specific recombinase XerD
MLRDEPYYWTMSLTGEEFNGAGYLSDVMLYFDESTFKVNINGREMLISTEIKCFNEPINLIFPVHEPMAQQKSFQLMRIFTECQDFIYHNPYMNPKRLKEELTYIVSGRPPKKNNIEELFDKFTQDKYTGTKKIYLRTLDKIIQFDRHADIESIDTKWLDKFSSFLKTQGANTNGISIHMRNLRAVFNYAIDNDTTNNYPFRKFKIKNEQTRKRDLTAQQLTLIRDCTCQPFQMIYRDLFMLIFYLCGINISDLLLLTKSNINNNRIEYHRKKTNKYYSIKIEPEAQAILDKYQGKKFLLSPMDSHSDYHHFLQRMNQQLKKLGMNYNEGKKWTGIPINPKLSTYYARHSWASIAAEIDIPTDTIALTLGHNTPYTTTDIYINHRLKKIDNANRMVLDYIKKFGGITIGTEK